MVRLNIWIRMMPLRGHYHISMAPEGGPDDVSDLEPDSYPEPEVDDIKVEHHLSAGFDAKIFHFNEYCGHTPNTQVGSHSKQNLILKLLS